MQHTLRQDLYSYPGCLSLLVIPSVPWESDDESLFEPLGERTPFMARFWVPGCRCHCQWRNYTFLGWYNTKWKSGTHREGTNERLSKLIHRSKTCATFCWHKVLKLWHENLKSFMNEQCHWKEWALKESRWRGPKNIRRRIRRRLSISLSLLHHSSRLILCCSTIFRTILIS